jgi:hypothetical protein
MWVKASWRLAALSQSMCVHGSIEVRHKVPSRRRLSRQFCLQISGFWEIRSATSLQVRSILCVSTYVNSSITCST